MTVSCIILIYSAILTDIAGIPATQQELKKADVAMMGRINVRIFLLSPTSLRQTEKRVNRFLCGARKLKEKENPPWRLQWNRNLLVQN